MKRSCILQLTNRTIRKPSAAIPAAAVTAMSAVLVSPLPLASTSPTKTTHNTIVTPFIKKSKTPSISCDFGTYENNSPSSSQNWTIDSNNPIHIILKPSSSSPLTMASSMDPSIKNSKRVCLFYCSEMKDLAERIASESDDIELRGITWRTFEDGFPNLFISNAHGIRGQHVAFLASFRSPGVIFEQLSVIYALPKLFVSSFTLVLPFFPTGTFERMEEEGDVATAFTLARILSNIPISKGGPTSLVIFDIHALQERFYFGDNILPCFESGIPLLLNRLQKLPDSDNIAIAFPDDGAWKRFHKQLQHFPMIVCTKVREGDQRIVCIKEGDPKGHHVVIVDDLVQSGGTLLECQKVLAKHGAAKISAYVTHGIFPNGSWQRFKCDSEGNPENGMTYFWITDSCPQTVQQVKNKSPFEVLSLAAPIAAALQETKSVKNETASASKSSTPAKRAFPSAPSKPRAMSPAGSVTEDEIKAVLLQNKQVTIPDLVGKFISRLKSKEEKDAFAATLRRIVKIQKTTTTIEANYVVLRE